MLWAECLCHSHVEALIPGVMALEVGTLGVIRSQGWSLCEWD